MKKKTQKKGQKRVLATKKLSQSQSTNEGAPLQFKQVTASELLANRNSAYSYLVR